MLAPVVASGAPAAAQEHGTIAVAPSCVEAGVPTRILVLGRDWGSGPVELLATTGGVTTPLGRVTPRISPRSQQPGTFSFVATVTPAPQLLEVTAAQERGPKRSVSVSVQSTCPQQLSVKPPCLGAAGTVEVSGSGFTLAGSVRVDVDPFGDAEAPPQDVPTNGGAFAASVSLPLPTRPIPILVSQVSRATTAALVIREVVFVDPCPPPASTSTTRGTTTTVGGTTTTAGAAGTTTTLALGTPPELPTETPPGTTVKVSISPRTVRPGRCAVLVIWDAPAGAAVMARFADGPPVNAQIGGDGRKVVSVCVPHDSGGRLGAVGVLLSIGPLGPVEIAKVLRVPSRAQPPLLQVGSDSRRS